MSKTAAMLSSLFSKRRDLESIKLSSKNYCSSKNKNIVDDNDFNDNSGNDNIDNSGNDDIGNDNRSNDNNVNDYSGNDNIDNNGNDGIYNDNFDNDDIGNHNSGNHDIDNDYSDNDGIDNDNTGNDDIGNDDFSNDNNDNDDSGDDNIDNDINGNDNNGIYDIDNDNIGNDTNDNNGDDNNGNDNNGNEWGNNNSDNAFDNDNNLEHRSNVIVLTDSIIITVIETSALEYYREDNDDNSISSFYNEDMNSNGCNPDINLVVTADSIPVDSIIVPLRTCTLKSHCTLDAKNRKIRLISSTIATNISLTSDLLSPHRFHIPYPRTATSVTENGTKSSSFTSLPLHTPVEYRETKGSPPSTALNQSNDLASTSNDLASTSNDLASTSNDLASTSNDLASTSNDLASTSNDLASTLPPTLYSSLNSSSSDNKSPLSIHNTDLQDFLMERSLLGETSSKSMFNNSSNNLGSEVSTINLTGHHSPSLTPPPPPPPLVASFMTTSTDFPLSTIASTTTDTRNMVVSILAAIKTLENKLAKKGIKEHEILALISPLKLKEIFPTIHDEYSISNDDGNDAYISDRKVPYVTADEGTSSRIHRDCYDLSPQPQSTSHISEASISTKDLLKKSSRLISRKNNSGSELYMQRQSSHSTLLLAPLLSSRPSYRSLTSVVSSSGDIISNCTNLYPARQMKSRKSTYRRVPPSPLLPGGQSSPSTYKLDCSNEKQIFTVNNENSSKICTRNLNIFIQQFRWQQ
jgi:hypothetical protein